MLVFFYQKLNNMILNDNVSVVKNLKVGFQVQLNMTF